MELAYKYIDVNGRWVLVDEGTDFKIGDIYLYKSTFLDGTVKTKEDFDKHSWNISVVTEEDIPYIERAINGKNSQNNLRGVFKIICAEKELNLDVPILPNWREWEFEKTVKDYSAEVYPINGNSREEVDWIENQKYLLETGFIAGYNHKKGDYTEEDLRKAYEAGGNSREDDINGDGEIPFEEYLQSIRKVPKYIVVETDVFNVNGNLTSITTVSKTIKTITNSDGKQECIIKGLIF